jgi:hypothetical protein
MKKKVITKSFVFFFLLLNTFGCTTIKIRNGNVIQSNSKILKIDFYQVGSLLHLKSINSKNCNLKKINIVNDTSKCLEINNFCPPVIFLENPSGFIYCKLKLDNGNYFLLIKNKRENYYRVAKIYKEKSMNKTSIRLR